MSTAGHTPYCVVMSSIYTLPCSSVPTMFSGFLGFSQCEWLCGARGINNPRSVQGLFQATTLPAGLCPTGHQQPCNCQGLGHARKVAVQEAAAAIDTPPPCVATTQQEERTAKKPQWTGERVWGFGG